MWKFLVWPCPFNGWITQGRQISRKGLARIWAQRFLLDLMCRWENQMELLSSQGLILPCHRDSIWLAYEVLTLNLAWAPQGHCLWLTPRRADSTGLGVVGCPDFSVTPSWCRHTDKCVAHTLGTSASGKLLDPTPSEHCFLSNKTAYLKEHNVENSAFSSEEG